jgi:hypothetical protein
MNSSLPIYFSKSTLTLRVADYSNVYLLPAICLVGMLTNLASSVVSLRITRRDHILKYILINSSSDFWFLLSQFFLCLFRCGTLCPFGYTYAAKFYELYIYLYFGYVLITFQALFNLTMTLQRLRLFSNNQMIRKSSHSEITVFHYVGFFTIAILINAPNYLFSKEIIPFAIYKSNETLSEDEILYEKNVRDLFRNQILEILLIILTIISNPGSYIVIGVINAIVAFKFRKFIKKKKDMLKNRPSKPVFREWQRSFVYLTTFIFHERYCK